MAQFKAGHYHWRQNHFLQPVKTYHCGNGKFSAWYLGKKQRKFGGISNNERRSRLLKCKDINPFLGSKLHLGNKREEGRKGVGWWRVV